MSRTIRVYRPIFKHNNKVINTYLDSILEKIESNSRENNLRNINNYPTIVNKYNKDFNNSNQKGGIIYKYRENYKPYIGDLNNNNITPIDKTIVETTTFLYDTNIKCICLEYNKEGTSEKEFKHYFESFLPENYSLELETVYNQTDLDKVLNSSQIRSLELKLNLNSNENDIFSEGIEKDQNIKDLFSGLMNGCIDAGNNLEANFAYWKFDLGRFKGSFNFQSFQKIMEIFNIDSEKIESMKVKFKENNSALKEYDLKTIGKQYSFKILENSSIPNPGVEYRLDTLQKIYDETHLTQLIDNLIPVKYLKHEFDLEKLMLIPNNNFKVEFKK